MRLKNDPRMNSVFFLILAIEELSLSLNMLVGTDNNCFSEQINEFVKRARAAKIHAYIISHLKKEMPAMMGKAKTQKRLIDNLEDEFAKVLISLSHVHFVLITRIK